MLCVDKSCASELIFSLYPPMDMLRGLTGPIFALLFYGKIRWTYAESNQHSAGMQTHHIVLNYSKLGQQYLK